MEADLLTIGRILRPHGIRGQVRILPLTAFPERFRNVRRVFVGTRDRHQAREVTEVSIQGRFVILGLSGIDDRDAAEALRGLEVMIPESERTELPDGHYFVYELVGIECYRSDGSLAGRVTDVMQTAANDVFVVEGTDGVHLVPGVKAIVKEIDLQAKRMVVDWLEGM
jgi:16S rRNA processing protein RimM